MWASSGEGRGIFREKNCNNSTKTVLKTRVLIFTTRRLHQICLTAPTTAVWGDGNHVAGRGRAGWTPPPSVRPSRASSPRLGWAQSPPGFTLGCSDRPGGLSTGTGEPQSPPPRQFRGDRPPQGTLTPCEWGQHPQPRRLATLPAQLQVAAAPAVAPAVARGGWQRRGARGGYGGRNPWCRGGTGSARGGGCACGH